MFIYGIKKWFTEKFMTPCYYYVRKVHKITYYRDFGFTNGFAYKLECDATAHYTNGYFIEKNNISFGLTLISSDLKDLSVRVVDHSPLVITSSRCDRELLNELPGLAQLNPPKRYYEPVGQYAMR